MTQNIDRILTTHTGSLPRGRELTGLYANRQKGEAFDADAIASLARNRCGKLSPDKPLSASTSVMTASR